MGLLECSERRHALDRSLQAVRERGGVNAEPGRRMTLEAPPGQISGASAARRGGICLVGVRSTDFPGGPIGRACGERAGRRGADQSRSGNRQRKTSKPACVERWRRRRRGERRSCYSSLWQPGWRAAAEMLLVLDKAEKETRTSTLTRTRRLTAAAMARPPSSGSGRTWGRRAGPPPQSPRARAR